MALSLQRQLSDAYYARKRRDGLTFDELLRLSKLDISTDSLSRKIRGKQVLYDGEIEALAVALRIEVRAGRREVA